MNNNVKQKAIALRKQGKSFKEISVALGIPIPKSTLSGWCRNIEIPPDIKKQFSIDNKRRLENGRNTALINRAINRRKYFADLKRRNSSLSNALINHDTSKIALAMLFIAEGSKNKKGSLVFCNADPFVIELFLHLLRSCYKLNEERLHCTVQCRADQNVTQLIAFWSEITGIPDNRFYKTQIDRRTIGKPTKKIGYKGVCRIDLFSAEIFHELMLIPSVIFKGH